MLVKLRVSNGKAAGTTYLVWKTPYIIGRHAQANLQIDNTRVSVYHCCLIMRGTEVWVRDMDSTNGTFVNDEQITDEVRLSLGDRIQVGPAILEVLQEATGAIPMGDRADYTPTAAALPAVPKLDRQSPKTDRQKHPPARE
jgi:pSer/pThr/pTyr-binding forkhead associated (FHA) protein